MTAKTNIEWTEATWNPLVGCSRKSPGCLHCYAERMAKRQAAMAAAKVAQGLGVGGAQAAYAQVVRYKEGKPLPQWNGKVEFVREALEEPLRWRSPKMIFVNSMSDLGHESVPFEWMDQIFAVMALTRRHTFQALTKRPDRLAKYLVERGKTIQYWEVAARELGYTFKFEHESRTYGSIPFPLRNVWIGASVENQEWADKRVRDLLLCAAAVRFLSYEPALGPLNVRPYLIPRHLAELDPDFPETAGDGDHDRRVHWVIVGCESGPGMRPFDLDWARSIRDQCAAAGVALFIKQLRINGRVSHDPSEWPEDLRVREFPNAAKPAA